MSENGSAAKFGVGLLIGAAVGFAIGILYAPSSGKETRAIIKEKAEKAENKAEELVEEAKKRTKKIIDDAKGKSTELKTEDLE